VKLAINLIMPIFATSDRAKLANKSTCALYTDLDLSLKLFQNFSLHKD